MKTKHLFFAAALAASFTACTSDELVEVQQGTSAVERPTVENVQLNFVGGGVDSRLSFNNGWAWEATDSIGALLMDTPSSTDEKDSWTERYTLQSYVNTSYPFTYNTADGTWGCPGKMLEGNYFFAFPWSSYDGGRYVKHSLIKQTQKGVSEAAKYESYADNQFFIGYSQIKKGTGFDILNDIEMTSVLGAIQVKIVNNGSKTYHINKIQLSGADVVSELTFNPTDAKYGTKTDDNAFNVSNGTWFNYAYYTGNDKASEWSDDMTEEIMEDYDRAEALRAVVKTSGSGTVAQLDVTGTADERAIAKGATGYVVIMTNSVADVEDLSLSIYTDEGVIKNIDLDNVEKSQTGVTYAPAVEKIAPDVANTVVVKFDDSALSALNALEIHTEGDLLQLLGWNANVDLATDITATLAADVKFTKEMYDIVKANKLIDLTILGTENTLTLAEDIPANILDEEKITLSVKGIIAENDIELTKKSKCTAQLTIAEGAVLNIDDKEDAFWTNVVNEGTINVAAIQYNLNSVTNAPTGIINIAKGADVQNINNYGVVNNNGYLKTIANYDSWTDDENETEEVDATINLGEEAVLKSLTNYATVNAAKNSRIGGTNGSAENDGLIACADNTIVFESGFTNNSMIALTLTTDGDVTEKQYSNTSINTLILNGTTTTVKHATTGISYLIAMTGAELKIDNKVNVTFTGLIVKGDATITSVLSGDNKSNVNFTTVTIEEGATLTNNAVVKVTGVAGSINNKGVVKNNGEVKFKGGNYGEWLYDTPIEYTDTPNPEEKENLVFNGGNLFDLSDDVDSNDIYESLTINAELNMSEGFEVSGADKTNADYKSVLADAPVVNLNNNIIGLKEKMAVTMKKLVVKSNAVIDGSYAMELVTVDDLTVEAGAMLTINNGYLKMNVTAKNNRGCEYIDIEEGAAVKGYIIANNADVEGGILYWNNVNKLWQTDKTDAATNLVGAELTANTASELAFAVTNGASEITLGNDVNVEEALVFNAPATRNVEVSDFVLNLGSYTITSEVNGILVENGTLTINANREGGVVSTGIGTYAAVEALGENSKVVINEGTYTTTGYRITDVAGVKLGNAAVDTRNNGKVEINGGYFSTPYTRHHAGNANPNVYYVLNADDEENEGNQIVVNGGEFLNFNPAKTCTEKASVKDNLLGEGKAVEIYKNGEILVEKDSNLWEDYTNYAWAYRDTDNCKNGVDLVYKVVDAPVQVEK